MNVLDGGAGINTVNYQSSVFGISINLSNVTQNIGDAGQDTLTNIQNVIASSFDDVIIGDANANLLLAGDGDDTLQGGLGNNTLNGGDGDDTVMYVGTTSPITVFTAFWDNAIRP